MGEVFVGNRVEEMTTVGGMWSKTLCIIQPSYFRLHESEAMDVSTCKTVLNSNGGYTRSKQ